MLHTKVAQVDVGSAVRATDHVRLLVAVVFAGRQTRVESARLPAGEVHVISAVDLPTLAVVLVDLSIRPTDWVYRFGAEVRTGQGPKSSGFTNGVEK